MKALLTADLHYNVSRSTEPARRLIEEINDSDADVVVLVGDTAGHDTAILSECLHLFDSFGGDKLFVAGNHELWTHDGDSYERYEREIPAVAREAGFHCLDAEPFVRDGVAFVGSVGWYDYSFRRRELEIPIRFYEAKVGPGAAVRLDEFHHLLEPADDIPDAARSITTRWMDGTYVRLPFSDVRFVEILCEKLDRQLGDLPEDTTAVVACVHHLPFAEFVPAARSPAWDFGNAFLGAARFGEILLGHPRVRHVFCGHSHQSGNLQKGSIRCTNIGSTYRAKRYETLEC